MKDQNAFKRLMDIAAGTIPIHTEGKMSKRDVDTRLRSQQKTTLEYINKVRDASGPFAADCYIGGLILGIAEYMTDRYGRRAAYSYLAGFADDLIFAESSNERLGK